MGTPTKFFESYTFQAENMILLKDPMASDQILFHMNTPHILFFGMLT